MRFDKMELVHTHALLAELESFISEDSDVPTPEYDGLSVLPAHIHKPKKDHEAAILTLAEELTAALDTAETPADATEKVVA